MKPEKREKIYIYGKHALMEALENAPHAIRKVFLARELGNDEELQALLAKQKLAPEWLKGHEADRMVGEETAHQGVIAIADPGALTIDIHDFLRDIEAMPQEKLNKTMLVLLDELTDPHNVGAIIRSAAAFGARAVLIPAHNQAPITGSVVKASAGMVFRVPIVQLGNTNQAIDKLKDFGFQIYGLGMHGAKTLAEESFSNPTLIIVGNEGKGIRQKTLERCDTVIRIPMDPRCESLNAPVSAAIVLYAWHEKQ